MFDIGKILHIFETATEVTPDFLKLGEEVIKLVKGKDQEVLKTSLSEARARSNQLHLKLQEAAKD